jgi:hypothetical protein
MNEHLAATLIEMSSRRPVDLFDLPLGSSDRPTVEAIATGEIPGAPAHLRRACRSWLRTVEKIHPETEPQRAAWYRSRRAVPQVMH